jgi:hypothetical protein
MAGVTRYTRSMMALPAEAAKAEVQELSNLDDNPVCKVQFDAEVPCITVIWKRPFTSAQLRFVGERLIDMIRQHKVSKILGDDTALPLIDADDQKWLAENWIPRAAAAGLRVAANKSPEAYFGRLAIERIKEAQRQLTIRSFEQFEQARGWLKGVRA